MFVADALGHPATDRMQPHFIDNTDPEGSLASSLAWAGLLDETLVVVMSKSGTTPETRNGMLVVAEAYRKARASISPATPWPSPGSGRSSTSRPKKQGWLARFPMWDWVGGRTSEMSAVGLVPGFLQGLDMDGVLAGAAAMDVATRAP